MRISTVLTYLVLILAAVRPDRADAKLCLGLVDELVSRTLGRATDSPALSSDACDGGSKSSFTIPKNARPDEHSSVAIHCHGDGTYAIEQTSVVHDGPILSVIDRRTVHRRTFEMDDRCRLLGIRSESSARLAETGACLRLYQNAEATQAARTGSEPPQIRLKDIFATQKKLAQEADRKEKRTQALLSPIFKEPDVASNLEKAKTCLDFQAYFQAYSDPSALDFKVAIDHMKRFFGELGSLFGPRDKAETSVDSRTEKRTPVGVGSGSGSGPNSDRANHETIAN